MLLTLLLGSLLVQDPELPRTILSGSCSAAPVIDGAVGEPEWKDAKAIRFTMKFLGLNPASSSARPCVARFMNSAHALYIALQVPDETLNKSLDPLELDFAMVVFSRGAALAAGD